MSNNHTIIITILSTVSTISSILSIIASLIYFYQVSHLFNNQKNEKFNNKTKETLINNDVCDNLYDSDKSKCLKDTNCIKDIDCKLQGQPANRGTSNSQVQIGNRGDCSLIDKCFDKQVNSYSDFCTDDTIKSSILFYEN
jgi:hypothetical protein